MNPTSAIEKAEVTSEYIFNFSYSPNGEQIALSRNTVNSDVVLIENQK